MHDDTIGYEFEISVDLSDIFENLELRNIYIVTNLIGPDLRIIDIVVFVGEMVADDVVDLFLHEGADVVKDSLFLFSHYICIIKDISNYLN